MSAGRLTYWRLKLEAMAHLVLGRREAALTVRGSGERRKATRTPKPMS